MCGVTWCFAWTQKPLKLTISSVLMRNRRYYYLTVVVTFVPLSMEVSTIHPRPPYLFHTIPSVYLNTTTHTHTQLHIQIELHSIGPVGHWLRDSGGLYIADHPSEQVTLSGSHRWGSRRIVSYSKYISHVLVLL